MKTFRLPLLALALSTLSLGGCQKDSPKPTTTVTQSQQLTTGSWRLDQIKEGGQVTGTGSGIKDQYSLSFRTDGSFTQKTLADNSTYPGTWILYNTQLQLTDNKGSSNDVTLTTLSATELRYTFINKTGQVEERMFSAQP